MRTTDRSSQQRGHWWLLSIPDLHPKRFVLAILLATGCACPAQTYPQAPQTEEQPNTVRGTVVNAVTGAPVGRALVMTPGNSYAGLTDGEGHFEFTLPKPGSAGDSRIERQHYTFAPLALIARKPGFLDDPNYQTRAEATPGTEFTIPLLPEAIIKGRVIASESDPAVGIAVQLYSRQIQDGIFKWVQAGSAVANSNGEFRLAELLPGTYKLMTAEWMDDDPAVTVPGGQQYAFPPVYYPGVPDFAAAGTIQLTAGQTVEADLPVTRQPYYPVRIPVANADETGRTIMTVSVQGPRGPGYSLGYNGEKQRIEGLLPRGNYLVESATFGPNSTSGSVHLSVPGAPAESPTLTLTPSSAINLHVAEEFAAPEFPSLRTWNLGGRSIRGKGPRAYLQISAENADDFVQQGTGTLRPPTGADDDSLILENLLPGRYWLRLHSSRGYVAAATMGGLDLLHEPFVVAAGSSTPIEITMRDDAAELEGTVAGLSAPSGTTGSTFSSRFSPAPAWVYCVPLPDSPGQFEQLWVSPDGRFNSPMMVPGTYRLLASRSSQLNLPYRDAEAMQAYESDGQVVHLSAGQKVSVRLPAIPGSE